MNQHRFFPGFTSSASHGSTCANKTVHLPSLYFVASASDVLRVTTRDLQKIFITNISATQQQTIITGFRDAEERGGNESARNRVNKTAQNHPTFNTIQSIQSIQKKIGK